MSAEYIRDKNRREHPVLTIRANEIIIVDEADDIFLDKMV